MGLLSPALGTNLEIVRSFDFGDSMNEGKNEETNGWTTMKNEWMNGESCFPTRVHCLYVALPTELSLFLGHQYLPHPDNFLSGEALWSVPIYCSWLRFTNTLVSILVPIGPECKGPNWIWFYLSSRYLLTGIFLWYNHLLLFWDFPHPPTYPWRL